MSTYIDLAPGVGDVLVFTLDNYTAQTATGTDLATDVAPCKGRVVAITGWVDTLGGSTKCTDYDLMVEKGTTDLHTLMAVVNSSTNQGKVHAILSTTAATVAVAAGDIFHLDATLTGGTGPTVTGVHARVFMVRE